MGLVHSLKNNLRQGTSILNVKEQEGGGGGVGGIFQCIILQSLQTTFRANFS